jgi:transposase
MFQVEMYGRVRRAVRVEGRSQRAIAREFGLSRETVRKMLQHPVPGLPATAAHQAAEAWAVAGRDRRHSGK